MKTLCVAKGGALAFGALHRLHMDKGVDGTALPMERDRVGAFVRVSKERSGGSLPRSWSVMDADKWDWEIVHTCGVKRRLH